MARIEFDFEVTLNGHYIATMSAIAETDDDDPILHRVMLCAGDQLKTEIELPECTHKTEFEKTIATAAWEAARTHRNVDRLEDAFYDDHPEKRLALWREYDPQRPIMIGSIGGVVV